MPIGILFWALMIIWLIFSIAWQWGGVWGNYGPWGNAVLLFILFLLLGWGTFGPPIRG